MAIILNIDTSSKICSVALAQDGETIVGLESGNEMDHATSLAPFVKKCLNYLNENNLKLDAISVIIGPGSYTGLRIGLSMAKGLVYGLEIPLITLSSLEVMAVRAIFTYHDFNGIETIVPMMDARRMEVYTGVFNSSLKLELPEKPEILDENSLEFLKEKEKVIFIGDGIEKFKPLYSYENAIWLGNGMSHAKYMTILSEKLYKENSFSDIAYTTPRYLKEYQASQPKSKL